MEQEKITPRTSIKLVIGFSPRTWPTLCIGRKPLVLTPMDFGQTVTTDRQENSGGSIGMSLDHIHNHDVRLATSFQTLSPYPDEVIVTMCLRKASGTRLFVHDTPIALRDDVVEFSRTLHFTLLFHLPGGQPYQPSSVDLGHSKRGCSVASTIGAREDTSDWITKRARRSVRMDLRFWHACVHKAS